MASRTHDINTRLNAEDGFSGVFAKLQNALASSVSGFGRLGSAAGLVTGPMASVAKLVGGVALGVTALGGAFTAAISRTLELGDNLAKMSQRTGASVETLNGLRLAADLSGTSLDAVGRGLKGLSESSARAAAGNAEMAVAFKSMGVNLKDSEGALKSQDTLLLELADKFASYKDGTGKAALATKVFKDAGLEMLPMLNQGAEGLKKLIAEQNKYAPLTTETAKRAEIFNDTIRRLRLIFENFLSKLAEIALPTLQKLADYFLKARDNSDKFEIVLKALDLTFKAFATTLVVVVEGLQLFGNLLKTAAQAVMAAAKGEFSQAWDILKSGAGDFLKSAEAALTTIEGIWTNAPARVEEGGQKIKDGLDPPTEAFGKLATEAERAKAAMEAAINEGVMLTAEIASIANAQGIPQKLIDDEKERVALAKELNEEKEREEQLQKMLLDAVMEIKKEEEDRVKVAKEAAQKAADAAKAEWQKIWDDVNRGLTDSLYRAFESGKDFGKSFRDALVNLFKTTILKVGVQFITSSLGLGGAGGALANTAGTAGSLFSSSNPLSILGGIANLGANTGAMLGGLSVPITQGLGMSVGTSAGIAGVLGTIGTALPYIGIGLMAASALGLFDREPSQVKGRLQIGGSDFEDDASVESVFGPIGFSDDQTKQFSGKAGAVFAGVIAGGLDRVSTLLTDEQIDKVRQALQATTFSAFEGEFTTENFIGKFGATWIKETFRVVFAELDSEMVRLLDAFEGTAEETGQYVDTLVAAYSLLQGTNAALKAVIDPLGELGVEDVVKLGEAFGSLDAAISSTLTYVSLFYSETEQQGFLWDSLRTEFERLGLEMPATKQGFRDLVESLDLTTEEGRDLYAELMRIAPAFAEVAVEAEKAYKRIDNLHSSLSQLSLQTPALAAGDYASQFGPQQDTAANSSEQSQQDVDWSRVVGYVDYMALSEAADEAADAFAALRQSLREFMDSLLLGDLSTLTPQEKLAEAQAQYMEALASDSKEGLEDAARAYLEIAREMYATSAEYNKIFATVREDIGDVINGVGTSNDEATREYQQLVLRLQTRIADATEAMAERVTSGRTTNEVTSANFFATTRGGG